MLTPASVARRLGARREGAGRRAESGNSSYELVLLMPVLVLMVLFVLWAGRTGQARLAADLAAEEAATAAAVCCGPGEEERREQLVEAIVNGRPELAFLCVAGTHPLDGADRYVSEASFHFEGAAGSRSGVGVLGLGFGCTTDGGVGVLGGILPPTEVRARASEVVLLEPRTAFSTPTAGGLALDPLQTLPLDLRPKLRVRDTTSSEAFGALTFRLELDRPADVDRPVSVRWRTAPYEHESSPVAADAQQNYARFDYCAGEIAGEIAGDQFYDPVDYAVRHKDYLQAGSVADIEPGERGGTIRVNVNDDCLYESEEKFKVELFGENANVIVVDDEAVGTIQSEDDPPFLRFAIETASGSEGPILGNQARSVPGSPGKEAGVPVRGTRNAGGEVRSVPLEESRIVPLRIILVNDSDHKIVSGAEISGTFVTPVLATNTASAVDVDDCPADYGALTALGGEGRFEIGAMSHPGDLKVVEIYDDDIYERDETFEVWIEGVEGAQTVTGRTVMTYTIQNQDPLPFLRWADSLVVLSEDPSSIPTTMAVKLVDEAGNPVVSGRPASFGYVVDGNASTTTDYSIAGGGAFKECKAGQDVEAAVTVHNDDDPEAPEYVVVSLDPTADAQISSEGATATVWILDDDVDRVPTGTDLTPGGPAEVFDCVNPNDPEQLPPEFVVDDLVVREGDGTASFYVGVSRHLCTDMSATLVFPDQVGPNVPARGSECSAGVDYVIDGTTSLHFGDGEYRGGTDGSVSWSLVEFEVCDDNSTEEDESVEVSIAWGSTSAPPHFQAQPAATATWTIVDNDGNDGACDGIDPTLLGQSAPLITIEPVEVVERQSAVPVGISLGQPLCEARTIIVETTDVTATGAAACGAGFDYQSLGTGSTVRTSGESPAFIPVGICRDAGVEGEETFEVWARWGDDAPGPWQAVAAVKATVTILDDDFACIDPAADPVPEQPVFGFPVIAYDEDIGAVSFEALLSSPLCSPRTITITPTGGTADLVGGDQCLTNADARAERIEVTTNGTRPLRLPVVICDDFVDDGDETFNVSYAWRDAVPAGWGGVNQDVTITDDDRLVVSVESLDVMEGRTGTFTLKLALASPPLHPVTVTVASDDIGAVTVETASADSALLTFTTLNWNTAQTVTVTGAPDDDASDEQVTVSLVASSTDHHYDGEAVSVKVNVEDDEEAGLVVDPATDSTMPLEVSENGSKTFTVALASEPLADVTVTVVSTDRDAAAVNPGELEFTRETWADPQTVNVSGVHDVDASDEDVTVRLQASPGFHYTGVSALVAVKVIDDEEAGLVVVPATDPTMPLSVVEEGSATFTVRLASEPSADVTVRVTVSVGAGAVTVDTAWLTFTSATWDDPQTVTVWGIDDGDVAHEVVTVSLTVTSAGGDYTGVSASVAVKVIDNDVAGLVVDPTSLTVDEDGSATFTVRLASEPSADVGVTVTADTGAVTVDTASLEFKPATWETPQTVTVSGVIDADEFDELATVTLAASGDGGYDGETASVSVAVTDTVVPGLVVDPATDSTMPLEVDEDGSATFAVRLASEPSADVTVSVTVSEGAGAVTVDTVSLTYTPVNWETPRTVTVTGVDDPDAFDADVTVSLSASSTDTDYGGETASVSVTVIDDDTPGLVVDPPRSLDVGEGSSATFTVALATQPSADVKVMVSSGDSAVATAGPKRMTFTTLDWETPQMVTVSGVVDDDGADERVTVSLSASSTDTDYDGETASLAVTVTDDDTPGLVVDPESLTVDEDGSATFKVRLATEPDSSVLVSLSSSDIRSAVVSPPQRGFNDGNWNSWQRVTVSGVADSDLDDDSVTVSLVAASTDADYDGKTASVSVTVIDTVALGLVVSEVALDLNEGASATFTVRLVEPPSAPVTVAVGSGNDAAVTVSVESLLFTTLDWETPRMVTVQALVDDDASDEAVMVSLSATSTDSRYQGETASLAVTVSDDDVPGFVVSATSLEVDEGSSATFTVRLTTQPKRWVDVAVVTSVPVDGESSTILSLAVTVNPSSFRVTHENWTTPRTVRVSGVGDADAANESAIVALVVSETYHDDVIDEYDVYLEARESVDVTVLDDETAGLAVSESWLGVVEEQSATFTVRLTSRPKQPVTVKLASSDQPAARVRPEQLVFTTNDWAGPQTATVEGVSDVDGRRESVDVSLVASSADGDYRGVTESVAVTVSDIDVPGMLLSAVSLGVVEGRDASFTVRLATQPAADVTVAVSSSDPAAATVDLSSVTFTSADWHIPRTVKVSGVPDDDLAGAYLDVSLEASSADDDYRGVTESVAVTVSDDDAAGLLVSGSFGLAEGAGTSFTVRLAAQPSAPVTVAVSSGDPGAVSVDTSSLTFSAADWEVPQTVMVFGVPDADAGDEFVLVSLEASSTDGDYEGTSRLVAISVSDSDIAGVVASAASLDVVERGDVSFTVWLATEPLAPVTVAVASSDVGAVSVDTSSLTFSAADWEVPRTVMVFGVPDADAGDESPVLLLVASSDGSDYAGEWVSVDVAVDDPDVASLVVSATSLTVVEDAWSSVDVQLATQPSAPVTVTVMSDDVGAAEVSPVSWGFTAADWDVPQRVMVFGITDDDAFDESADVLVSLSSSDLDYEGLMELIEVAVRDSDVPGLVVNGSLSVNEGASAALAVRLATQPSAPVTVTVMSDDVGAATVDLQSLTFTGADWRTEQSVTVSGVLDDDAAHELVVLSLSASSSVDDYAGPEASVSVTVRDGDVAGLVLGGVSGSVGEDSSATFTVRLATRPSAPVTVAVSSGDVGAATVAPQSLTFTPETWADPQTVTVSGVADDDAAGAFVVVSLSASSSDGDYAGEEALVSVTVTDDDVAGLWFSGPASVPEDSSAIFTVGLATRPSAPVSVSVSSSDRGALGVSPTSLRFDPEDWPAPRTVRVSGVADADAADESVVVSLSASSSDGDYAGEEVLVSVTVTDGVVAGLVVSPVSVPVDEGASAAFTVWLATQPLAPVLVLVSSDDDGAAAVGPASLSFTAADWHVPRTVTVTGVLDADNTDESVVASLLASSGDGDYEGPTASVAVTVSDINEVGLVVSPVSVSFAEDSAATFTVWLATQPLAPVLVSVSSEDTGAVTVLPASLAFTATDWWSPQTVTVTGVSDTDSDDESVVVTLSASSSGADYEGRTASLTARVADTDVLAGLVVSESALAIDEGSSATFTVRLATRPQATQPPAPVTVSVSPSDRGAVSADPVDLTFIAADWATEQTVTVTGVPDDDATHESVAVLLTSTWTFENHYERRTAVVTVDVSDTEVAALVVSRAWLRLAEDSSATFTVRLATRPSAVVTVSVSSDDDGAAAVGPASLRFTPLDWDVPQTVTVSGVADVDSSDEWLTVSLLAASTGGEYEGRSAPVTVRVTDTDAAGLVISELALTLAEDSAATFSVRLTTAPASWVTVAVGSSDVGAAVVEPRSLIFTAADWAVPRTVTVSGVADVDTSDESVVVSLVTSSTDGDYAGLPASLPVTVSDTGVAALVVGEVSLGVAEGASASFTVQLAEPPSAPVTVAVSSSDAGAATAGPPLLTFSAGDWNVAQTVTVLGVTDDDAADESVVVSLLASSTDRDYVGRTASVAVGVSDADVADLLPIEVSLGVAEGASASFTVQLTARPTSDVVVAVSSTDVGAAVVQPAWLMFTAADWEVPQPVTVSGVADDDAAGESVVVSLEAVSAGADYAGRTASVAVTVSDADVVGLVVDDVSLDLAEDASAPFTVWLATRPLAPVTVAVSSSDVGAATVEPASLMFTAADWEVPRTVTVSGVADDDAADESLVLSLLASSSDGAYAGEEASPAVEVRDIDEAALVVGEELLRVAEDGSATLTVRLAARPLAPVTVAVSSDDAGAATVDPVSLTFTAADWEVARTVTVSGVADAGSTDESVVVSLVAASSDGDHEGLTASVAVAVRDNDVAALLVGEASLRVAEDTSTTFEVRLAVQPASDVAVAVSSGDDTAAAVMPGTLTFTAAAWQVARTVTVSGVADVDTSDESVVVSLVAASSDGDYEGLTASVAVAVRDIDVAALVLSATSLQMSEGDSATFMVQLASQPSAPVTVWAETGQHDVAAVWPTRLTFSRGDWNQPQTVTVSGVADRDPWDESVVVTVWVAHSGDVNYEGRRASVAVAVTDPDAAGLAVSEPSLRVAEGGSATFTVRLTSEPASGVVIGVSSGDDGAVAVEPASSRISPPVTVFTSAPPAWAAERTVTVFGLADDDAADESVVVVLSTSSSDGNYAGRSVSVAVTVADTGVADLVVGPTSLGVGEGGSATFEVRLVSQPLAPVVVAVSSGDAGAATVDPASLTFTPGDWDAPQQVTVSGVADVDAADESLLVSLVALSTDEGYMGRSTSVAVTVADTGVADLVVGPTSLGVAEGGSATFEVWLASRPSAPVTVAVSSADGAAVTVDPVLLTFAPALWDVPQQVAVSGVVDDDDADESVVVSLVASSTGGDYEGREALVAVSVSDTGVAGLVVSGSLGVVEGASATFEVWLASRPSASVTVAVSSADGAAVTVDPVLLTFAPAVWDVPQQVAVSGVVDDDDADESVVVSLLASSTGGDYEGREALVAVRVSDTDVAGLVVSGSLGVVEGASATFEVWLASRPSASVTVAVSSADEGAVTVDPVLLTFAPAVWDVPQQVTVSGVVDDDATDEQVVVELLASSTDDHYGGETASVEVDVSDADAAGLVVGKASLTVTEGASARFTVRLATQPSAPVTVALGVELSDDDVDGLKVQLLVESLLFTPANWAEPREVVLTAWPDADATDESVVVSLNASSTDSDYADRSASVTVTVKDIDAPTLVFSATSLSVAESASRIYGVWLSARPTTDVVVSATRSGRGVSVTPPSLTFTRSNWSVPQEVRIAGVADDDTSDHTVTLIHRASGSEYDGASSSVTVTVSDDDTPGVTVAPASLAVTEGGSGSYTVVLGTRPLTDVTVAVTAGDGVVVSPSTLRFTDYNWHVPRTVDVTVRRDADADDGTATLTHTAAGGGYDSVTIDPVTVTVVDDGTPGVTVLPTGLSVAEGSSATYLVVLDTQPSGPVTVTPSVAGSTDVTVSPSPLTFTPSDWDTAQAVTVTAAVDADTTADTAAVSHAVAGGDYGSVSAPAVTVLVADGETLGVTITPTALPITEGGTADYTVVLDAAPADDVTVTLRTSGSGVTVNAATLTFTTTDWGTPQTVEVGAAPDTDARNDLALVTHVLSGGGYDAVSAPVVVVAVTDPVGVPSLDAVRAGDEAFRAEWSPAPVGAGVTITGYEVRYRPAPNGATTTVQVNASENSLLVDGLTGANNQDFDVELRALTGVGTSGWSVAARVRVGAPEMPSALRVVGSDGSLNIFWEPPPNEDLLTRNGMRVRYFVTVALPGAAADQGFDTHLTHVRQITTSNLVSLVNGTGYAVTVRSDLYGPGTNPVVLGAVAETRGTPGQVVLNEDDPRHAVLRETVEHIVAGLESADPQHTAWLRQAFDWVVAQEHNADGEGLHWRLHGVHLRDTGDRAGYVSVLCESTAVQATRRALPWCAGPNLVISLATLCGESADPSEFRLDPSDFYGCFDGGTATDLDPFELSTGEGLRYTVVHELAHAYSRSVADMTTDAGRSSLPLGATWLYFMANNRSTWTLNDDTCASELLAVIVEMVVLDGTADNILSQCLGLDGIAGVGCDDATVAGYCEVIRNMMTGVVPQWYTERYAADSATLWADIIGYTTFRPTRDPAVARVTRVNLLHGFADAFGGYCSPNAANDAMFDTGTTITNPWVDGGCEPDPPSSLAVGAGTTPGSFDVSWTAPASVGGAPLSGYVVEWKRGNQSYSSTRRLPFDAGVAGVTLDLGAGTAVTYIRVRALNEIGPGAGGEATCTHSGGSWQCTSALPDSRGH